jgi:hypothetical protein
MKNMKKIPEALKALPYGGDRKPGDPTLDEIAEAMRRSAGVPVGSSYRGPRTAKVHTARMPVRDHGDG